MEKTGFRNPLYCVPLLVYLIVAFLGLFFMKDVRYTAQAYGRTVTVSAWSLYLPNVFWVALSIYLLWCMGWTKLAWLVLLLLLAIGLLLGFSSAEGN